MFRPIFAISEMEASWGLGLERGGLAWAWWGLGLGLGPGLGGLLAVQSVVEKVPFVSFRPDLASPCMTFLLLSSVLHTVRIFLSAAHDRNGKRQAQAFGCSRPQSLPSGAWSHNSIVAAESSTVAFGFYPTGNT